MTRRERLEAKLEKRRTWAATRGQRGTSTINRIADKYQGDVAFNTQPGHIPERARVIRQEERAFEDLKMAEHHESKANGLERALDRAIFSDDPDAPEALKARIEELTEKRARMVAVNKAFRKGDEAYATAAGITVELAAKQREAIMASYTWTRQPYPAYELSNLSGNIGRLKKRLEIVADRRERTEVAEAAPSGVTATYHSGFDAPDRYVRVTFAEKPAREILSALRDAGFRWGGGSWSGETSKLPDSVVALLPPREKVPDKT